MFLLRTWWKWAKWEQYRMTAFVRHHPLHFLLRIQTAETFPTACNLEEVVAQTHWYWFGSMWLWNSSVGFITPHALECADRDFSGSLLLAKRFHSSDQNIRPKYWHARITLFMALSSKCYLRCFDSRSLVASDSRVSNPGPFFIRRRWVARHSVWRSVN